MPECARIGGMDRSPPDAHESAWIAVFCTGLLLTALAATVCLGLVAYHAASLQAVQPVVGCFVTGAVIMVVAAARLDRLSAARAATRGPDAR